MPAGACGQVKHRVPATPARGSLVGAALSQHAVFVGSDGVRLVNTTAAPFAGPRSVFHEPFSELARHLTVKVRSSVRTWRCSALRLPRAAVACYDSDQHALFGNNSRDDVEHAC